MVMLQAISTAADLARIHNSKVTVLVVDHPGAEGDPAVKMQVINKVGGHGGAAAAAGVEAVLAPWCGSAGCCNLQETPPGPRVLLHLPCCAAACLQSLHDAGCEGAEILEKPMESGAVLVGDVADEISADLVLISSEAVHTKQVRHIWAAAASVPMYMTWII